MLAAGAGATATIATWSDAYAARAPFLHGVASGDPLPDGVVLWTRVTPTQAATPGSRRGPAVVVTWEVAADRAFRRIVARGRRRTGPARDHTVHVDVRGLRPGRTYWFRFRALGRTSRIGRTRTAPRPTSPRPVRFAVMSCANYDWGYFGAYRHIAARNDLDAVLHLGDYLYEYGPGGPIGGGIGPATPRTAAPPRECVSLADYRVRHGHYRLDTDLQTMHARHPMIAIWDDHEVANDTWREGAENHDPSTQGKWRRRAAAGRRAWLEWLPVRGLDPSDPHRIHRRFRFGRHVDLWMLDSRRFRDELLSSLAFSFGSVDPAVNDPTRSMLGRPQEHWLTRGMRRSDATWKVLGNQVPFFPQLLAPTLPDQVERVLAPVIGQIYAPPVNLYVDDWNGFPAQRQRLTEAFADIGDVVILTGDVHQSFASDIPLDTGTYRLDRKSAAVEFICPGISSGSLPTMVDDVVPGTGRLLDTIFGANLALNNPWVRYSESFHTGYGVATFGAGRVRYDYWHQDDARQRRSAIRRGASWQSRRGTNRVESAR